MDEQVHDDMMELRQFMFDHVYQGTEAQSEEQRAKNMLRSLYEYLSSIRTSYRVTISCS